MLWRGSRRRRAASIPMVRKTRRGCFAQRASGRRFHVGDTAIQRSPGTASARQARVNIARGRSERPRRRSAAWRGHLRGKRMGGVDHRIDLVIRSDRLSGPSTPPNPPTAERDRRFGAGFRVRPASDRHRARDPCALPMTALASALASVVPPSIKSRIWSALTGDSPRVSAGD